jgi:hypothetical protein
MKPRAFVNDLPKLSIEEIKDEYSEDETDYTITLLDDKDGEEEHVDEEESSSRLVQREAKFAPRVPRRHACNVRVEHLYVT